MYIFLIQKSSSKLSQKSNLTVNYRRHNIINRTGKIELNSIISIVVIYLYEKYLIVLTT